LLTDEHCKEISGRRFASIFVPFQEGETKGGKHQVLDFESDYDFSCATGSKTPLPID
jgi:hypothetical protein